jgi:hypothetical protein
MQTVSVTYLDVSEPCASPNVLKWVLSRFFTQREQLKAKSLKKKLGFRDTRKTWDTFRIHTKPAKNVNT